MKIRIWHERGRANPWRWVLVTAYDWPDNGIGKLGDFGGEETRADAMRAAEAAAGRAAERERAGC